jgi:hypothetical protein
MTTYLSKKWFFLLIIYSFGFFAHQNINAQPLFACKIDGKNFSGVVKDASLVLLNKQKFIQIQAAEGDKMIYLYLQVSKINGFPANLKYYERDEEKKTSPESEIIWVPDGPEKPQWNAVDGKTVVELLDQEKKIISGTFDFKIEKFEYTSDETQKRPSMEVTDGKFTNITYKIDSSAQGK